MLLLFNRVEHIITELNTTLIDSIMSSTLLLNADAQPASILPLSIIDWQEAIRYVYMEKVEVLSYYEDWIVRSDRWSTQVPAIVMLREYQKPKQAIRLAKRNIFLRDRYTCQYCGVRVRESDATLDHVYPVSLGGKNTWENLTTACKPCNWNKSNSIRLRPKVKPYRPDFWELVEKRREQGWHLQHPSWADFLT
jgi:5-methylcytosine-specific restriction endonuclease McrA